jgi:hypothetical protein
MCENLVMGTELPLVKKVSLYNCEIDFEKGSFQLCFYSIFSIQLYKRLTCLMLIVKKQ